MRVSAPGIYISKRLLGLIAILSGLLLLIMVESTSTSPQHLSRLPLPILCTDCHSTPIQLSPLSQDPCGICHYEAAKPRLIFSIQHQQQVHQLGLEILNFHQDSGGGFQYDGRFQAVLHDYWQAKSDPLHVAELLAHATALLKILENEAHSGYWRSAESPIRSLSLLTSRAPQMPLLLRVLFMILVFIPILSLSRSQNTGLSTTIRRVQHRGPPADAAYVVESCFLKRRVPPMRVQSPFVFSIRKDSGQGNKYRQRYMLKTDTGYAMAPGQWNIESASWVAADAGDWLKDCADCHTTGFNPDDGTWNELGVSCESCHGAGSAHVDAANAAEGEPDSCTSCHTLERDPDNTPENLTFAVESVQEDAQARVEDLLADLEEVIAANPDWDPEAEEKPEEQELAERIGTLISFVESDGSWGFHNPGYTDDILSEAEDNMDELLDMLGM